MLSDEQVERYSRQIILPGVGGKQSRLLSATVAVVAAGEVGHTAAVYLAAGGIGRLRLADASPEAQETHRQIAALNPDCTVTLESSSADGRRRCIAAAAVAASDDLAGAGLINQSCVRHGVPFLLGWDDEGGTHVAMFAGHDDSLACWSCRPAGGRQPEIARECQPATAAFAGTVIATETMKSVLGIGTSLLGKRLTYTGESSEVTLSQLEKNEACKVCSVSRAPTAPDQ
jgi:molybdopterin/thiamine biosynthesis adenylyltransferase